MAGDYVISVRAIDNGKFKPEPGPSKFLIVPDGKLPEPKHEIKKGEWVDRVLKESIHSADAASGKQIGDMLVFIHGYNNSAKDVMWRHREIKSQLAKLNYKGTVVSFDWPSDVRAVNYLEDRHDAKQTAIYLVKDCIKIFSELQHRGCTVNIHLLAHSTGAFVVREAFDDADDNTVISAINWTVSQVMLVGADISGGSMSESNAKTDALFRHAVRITNYSNPHDSVLKLSNTKRAGTAPRVGRVGLPPDAPEHCVDVNCGEYFKTLNEKTAKFIGSFSHSWHFGDPVIARDIFYTIQGDVDRNWIPTRRVDGSLLYLRPEPKSAARAKKTIG